MFYRKYRPQAWEELATSKIRDTLGKAILENNWSHAYLLTGSRGTGKTTTARLIAKTVNCTNRKKGEEPCNKCDSCVAITEGRSLDVIEIDAASNTGVDDIRDLREKVKLAPASSKYKVYIIDEVHMLSTSAFNALLKTLEEPPAQVIFILATTDPQKLPETIVSRCLVYDFGRAKEEEIKNRLTKIAEFEKIEIKEEVLTVVAQRANGSHRDAQKILEQLISSGAKADLERLEALNLTQNEDVARKLLRLLAQHKQTEALKEIETFVAANGKFKDLILAMISQLRDILVFGKREAGINDTKILIEKLIEANSMLRDSPLPSLPLELVVVEWCRVPDDSGRQKAENRSEETENRTGAIKDTEHKEKEKTTDDGSGYQSIVDKWAEIVAATKPYNHSLNAFLKAANPQEISNGFLVIGVAYKFHKEKLEEPKNRDVLEQVISDIIEKEIKVKFKLNEKK
ncbi:DNA polymerase III subunit gamma/tau [Patescibacteria group bacterium]|nr:DNA polymerase III subunit gamma/tau [Patescibacteria group bacterium]